MFLYEVRINFRDDTPDFVYKISSSSYGLAFPKMNEEGFLIIQGRENPKAFYYINKDRIHCLKITQLEEK